MKTIFVMVKCELGQAYGVADAAVADIEQVSEVYSASGQYDLLMKCYLPDLYNHRLQGILAGYQCGTGQSV
jgi:DNA-binding Lrp family transcriptional regulator